MVVTFFPVFINFKLQAFFGMCTILYYINQIVKGFCYGLRNQSINTV